MLQAFWDDQKNLFLEFKIYKDKKFEIEPEDIKSIYIKFEIIPIDRKEKYQSEPPYLISVNKFCLLDDSLFIPINFEDLNHYDGLKIKFMLLKILFYSGKRILYTLEEIFEMADISIIEDSFENFFQEIKRSKIKIESSIVQEKVIETVDKDLSTNKEKRTYIYERNKIKNKIESDTIVSLINKGNVRLGNLEEELKNLKSMIRSLSINNTSAISYSAPRGGPPSRLGIEKIKRSKSPTPIQPRGKLAYLPELKALLKDTQQFKKYLKPMSKEELIKITLSDEKIIEKQEEIYHRQIEIIKKKEEKTLSLGNLKKPK